MAGAAVLSVAVLTPFQPADAASNLAVSGTVVDHDSGQPVDATISGGGSTTHTDASGHFTLVVQPGQQGFTIFYPGGNGGYYGSTTMSLGTSSIDVEADTDLGTVSLPSLRAVSLTITDRHGIAVDHPSLGGMSLGDTWNDQGAALTPTLNATSGAWFPLGPQDQGVYSLLVPDMSTPNGLPSTQVTAHSESGNTYLADLTDATETAPDAYSLPISGFDASVPPAPGNFSPGDNGETTFFNIFDYNINGQASYAARTGYTVLATPGGRTWSLPVSAASGYPGYLVDDLEPGTYTFQIRTESLAGPGAYSAPSPSVTVRRLPGRVATPTATVQGRNVTLTWEPPTVNADWVTGYRVWRGGAPREGKPVSGTRYVFKNLRPNVYRFYVAAVTPDSNPKRPYYSHSVRVRVR